MAIELKAKGKKSIHVLTRDVLKWLHEKGYKTISSDQILSIAMKQFVVLEKQKCEGLSEDIKWKKAQIKRKHGNLRGYRIDFEGEVQERAFDMMVIMVAGGDQPSVDEVMGLYQNNRPL